MFRKKIGLLKNLYSIEPNWVYDPNVNSEFYDRPFVDEDVDWVDYESFPCNFINYSIEFRQLIGSFYEKCGYWLIPKNIDVINQLQELLQDEDEENAEKVVYEHWDELFLYPDRDLSEIPMPINILLEWYDDIDVTKFNHLIIKTL